MRERRRASCGAVLAWIAATTAALVTFVGPAHGQEGATLGGQTFDLDLVTGPVVGPGRVVGLGGAYVALSDAIEAASWNPAAFAARGPWETDWFEWDVTAGLVPTTIRSSDFDNDGEKGFTYESFLFGSLGGGLRFGDFGLGLLANVQTYQIGPDTSLALAVLDYGVGYGFAAGQLVTGFALRTATLTITDRPSNTTLVDFGGSAPEVGAVLQPAGQRFRIGGAARMPVQSRGREDALVAAGLTLPRVIRLPWELQGGFAWQFGPRPLNTRFVNPHDEEDRLENAMLARRRARVHEQLGRERLAERLQLAQENVPPSERALRGLSENEPRDAAWWRGELVQRVKEERDLEAELDRRAAARERRASELSRRYLLVSTEVILVGPTNGAVGLESFLAQERRTSGRDVTVGLRAGIEGEPIEHYLKMRAGAYLEPSRFAGVGYRAHGTVGFDVRLFTWDIFGLLEPFTVRFGTAADVAERYLYLGLGLGIWH